MQTAAVLVRISQYKYNKHLTLEVGWGEEKTFRENCTDEGWRWTRAWKRMTSSVVRKEMKFFGWLAVWRHGLPDADQAVFNADREKLWYNFKRTTVQGRCIYREGGKEESEEKRSDGYVETGRNEIEFRERLSNWRVRCSAGKLW